MRGFGSLWRYMKHCLIAFVSDDGGFSLFSPDFPEFSSQGDCLEEAVDMATDCLRLLVDVYGKEGRPLPEPCDLARAKAHTKRCWQSWQKWVLYLTARSRTTVFRL
ncbi:hypothetical protein B5F76_06180 [Desulfovibrio sp. An276]|nr:hypothetical protein B5F76_06180 [Desulfovibrio sp. An276]